MADTSRIEELRRRVQRDPASIAFAQLAEEYRRAGRSREAIETCEDGLLHHPDYLSARVTLGRALLETGQLEAAQLELKQVLRAAPENLAALRGLADVHYKRGELREALAHYRAALEFARHDPELEHLVEQIQEELEPHKSGAVVVDGMSFDEVKETFLNMSLPDAAVDGDPAGVHETEAALPEEAQVAALSVPATDVEADAGKSAAPRDGATPGPAETAVAPAQDATVPADVRMAPESDAAHSASCEDDGTADPSTADTFVPTPLLLAGGAVVEPAVLPPASGVSPQVDALERWLEVILADRQRRS